MRRAELVAAGDLAAEGAGGLAGHVREWHEGISQRVFESLELAGRAYPPLGAMSSSIRAAHDAIAAAAYAAAARAGSSVVRAAARAAAARHPDDAPALDESPAGRLALGALSGVLGDRLELERSALAVPMSVRRRGLPVALERSALAAAFPGATPRLAVFAHGLCETEDAWLMYARRFPPYGKRLRDELGFTPVYVRYNTGRHISDNGRELARLLDRLLDEWPVEVAEIALIGHSMGGLVARSACHYGAGREAIARVRHVFSLGTPHRGAQLERLAHAAGAAMCRLPETRPVASALRVRSAGIKDLYHGYLVDEDWEDYDPQAFLVHEARRIPFLQTADHYFVAATVTRDPEAPLGRAVGDLLVSRASAWAQRPFERVRFPVDHYAHVGHANHFELLGHPAVADQLVRWLAPRPARALLPA
jgi:hypothetical protein